MSRPEGAGPVWSAEQHRAGRQFRWGQSQRRLFGCVHHHADHGLSILGGGKPVAHGLPCRFGGEVPSPPGGALLTDDLDHPLAQLGDGIQWKIIGPQQQGLVVRCGFPRP